MRVNNIYSLLACAAGLQLNERKRGGTDLCSYRTIEPLRTLFSRSGGDKSADIELVIRLLRSSPLWGRLEKSLDPNNTYDICIDVGMGGLNSDILLSWANEQPRNTAENLSLNCSNNDTPITLIVDRLIGAVVTALRVD